MTLNGSANTYEEARKLRLEENKKRFEDLGITKISKSLTELTHSQKKPQKQHISRARQRGILVEEPRRSNRTRNPIKSYVDEVDTGISFHRKRSRSYSSSWDSYLARPIEEVKVASCEERTAAFHAAEKLQVNLNTGNPYFVKSMLRSHVYSCFWLGLPKKFCDDHLPKSSSVNIELEDEEGNVHDSVYLAKRTGLSGGWRGFALEKKLDDGDALVFDLVEPTRFKIYIVRVSSLDVKEKLKTNMKLGFKQKKKKMNTGKSKVDGVDKNEGESEDGVKVNGIGSVEDCAMGTRRSKRRIAVK